jgi:hypothetical protein
MGESKLWYMEWVTAAWLGDGAIRLLRPATRGIWFDALNRMHEAGQKGEITGTVTDLALLCSCTPREMLSAIADLLLREAAEIEDAKGCRLHLDARGNPTCNGQNVTHNTIVTLRNRRMWREWKNRNSNRERQMRFRDRKRNGQGNGRVTPYPYPNTNPYPISACEKVRLLIEQQKQQSQGRKETP